MRPWLHRIQNQEGAHHRRAYPHIPFETSVVDVDLQDMGSGPLSSGSDEKKSVDVKVQEPALPRLICAGRARHLLRRSSSIHEVSRVRK